MPTFGEVELGVCNTQTDHPQVVVPLPDVGGRRKVLDLYTKPIPLSPNVDIELLARATPGFSGADLYNLVNKAALHASHHDKKRVEMIDLEHACDQVISTLSSIPSTYYPPTLQPAHHDSERVEMIDLEHAFD